MGLIDRIQSLLSVSAYREPVNYGVSLDDKMVEDLRRAHGGQLQPLPVTRTRWFLADLESAAYAADAGDLSLVGQLARSLWRDGTISGLMGTRTSGLVSLPKKWRGDAEWVESLTADSGTRSVFEEMCPAVELAKMKAYGIICGACAGELIPVKDREFPVLVTYEPQFLRYRWNENQWYFRSIGGEIPITPGDGRWVLHTPGGRVSPWQDGLWHPLGRSFITKEHAQLHRANYSGKLANPARVAYTPEGSSEGQRLGFLARLIAWGINSVFEMPPGWDVKLLESNGRGWEVFSKEIETCDREIMIAIAGQEVTTTGGAGFANADIHKSIRADLIQKDAEALAYTVNTQILPAYAREPSGELPTDLPRVAWYTKPAKDATAEANTLMTVGNAIEKLTQAMGAHGLKLDTKEVCARFAVPFTIAETESPDNPTSTISDMPLPDRMKALQDVIRAQKANGFKLDQQTVDMLADMFEVPTSMLPGDVDKAPSVTLAPTDVAKVVTVNEARASADLPPMAPPEGTMTVAEFAESKKPQVAAPGDPSENIGNEDEQSA